MQGLHSCGGSNSKTQELITFLGHTWEQFARSGTVPVALRKPIAESWSRCLKHGVNFSQTPPASGSDNGEALVRANAPLLEAASVVIERLVETIPGTDHIVALCDRRGRMLQLAGDPEVVHRARPHNFVPGSDWCEAAAGTNAIGTALQTGQPVHVLAFEHYCMNSHPWCCSAAPIRDPLSGQIIGVLDLTGGRDSFQPHSLALVVNAAHAVEQRLRDMLQPEEQRLVQVFWQQGVDRLPEGFVVVDRHARIVRVNPVAARLVGADPERLVGMDAAALGALGELLRQTLAQRQLSLRRTITLTDSSGGRRHCQVSCYLVDTVGPPEGALALIHEEAQPAFISTPGRGPEPAAGLGPGAAVRYTFETLMGRSPVFLQAVERARKAARVETTVLLTGESGTGKEVFAQAIHAASPRRHGPFVAFNCGAVPKELATSELFGYVEGAFSGASRQGRVGKFEAAQGGTLFLDEIGEAPPDLQVMLLRVLQEREVTRIGSNKRIPVDVRVIAATNADLTQAMAAGTVRKDLFYRLSVLPIHLPALRERREDISVLAEHFLERAVRTVGERKRLSADALDRLMAYTWPGNVRELENALQCAASLADGEYLTAADLGLPGNLDTTCPVPGRAALPPAAATAVVGRGRALITADQVRATVHASGGNLKEAARRLGIGRATLYRYLDKVGLMPEELRSGGSGP